MDGKKDVYLYKESMKTKIFQSIPQQAVEIRNKVFVEEQGFQNEFDDIDNMAAHLVVFDGLQKPIATCRVFRDKNTDTYILGRLAVIKEYRGKNIGEMIVKRAEKYIKEIGGKEVKLHAQCRITAFYNKLGFDAFGEVEDDEGCPHIWMRKAL